MYNKVDLLESECMADTDAAEDSAATAEAASPQLPSSPEADPAAQRVAAADQRHTPAGCRSHPAVEMPPDGAWAVRQLQGRTSADKRQQWRRSGTAAEGPAVPQGQQRVPRPSRVHVSAATGAGLGLLLQEIDRKVHSMPECYQSSKSLLTVVLAHCHVGSSTMTLYIKRLVQPRRRACVYAMRKSSLHGQVSIRSGLDALAASTAALGSRLLTQSVVGPPQMTKRPRHDVEADTGGAWRPGWPAEGSPLAAHMFAGPH